MADPVRLRTPLAKLPVIPGAAAKPRASSPGTNPLSVTVADARVGLSTSATVRLGVTATGPAFSV